jgi:hypothetical protein
MLIQLEECTMNSLGTSSRLLIAFALVLLMLGLVPPNSLAQTPPAGAIAIQLSTDTPLAPSVQGAGFPANGGSYFQIANATLTLNCSATPIYATISSTTTAPLGYVFVDNYLTMAANYGDGFVAVNTNYPAGNICSGGPVDIIQGNSYNDCFSTSYQQNYGSLLGVDPDTFASPGNTNSVLQGNAGGVPPIDVSTYLSSGSNTVSFSSLDAGVAYGSSSLYLVTNCTEAAVGAANITTVVPTTGTTPDLPAVFSIIPGQTLITDEDFSTSTGITNPLSDTPILLSTANPVTQAVWAGYTGGLPIAPSNIIIDAYNLGADAGSMVVKECYSSSAGPSTATNAQCPTVTSPNLTGNGTPSYLSLRHTADWGAGGKVSPAPGTTFSLLDFDNSADPSIAWISSPGTIPNSACINPQGNGTFDNTTVPPTPIPVNCFIRDTLVDVYGDQTTQRGTKPKTGTTTVAATNVPMIMSSPEAIPNPNTPNTCPLKGPVPLGPNVWVNAACFFDIVVNPATGATNGFQAAPPASVIWGWQNQAPALVPGPIPTGEFWASNPNPVYTNNNSGSCAPQATPCAGAWDVGSGNSNSKCPPPAAACANPGIYTTFSAAIPGFASPGDGTYLLNRSATDTFGIREKVISLITTGTCLNPETEPPYNVPSSFNAPCYTTSYPTTQVNLDSTNPTITTNGVSGLTFPAYSSQTYTVTCTDNLSGVASCNGTSETGSPLTVTLPSAPLNTVPSGAPTSMKTLTVGAGNNTFDEAGNPATPQSVNYYISCEWASIQLTSPVLPKGISFDPAATMVTNCGGNTAQKVWITITLTGPFGKTCNASTPVSTQLLFLPLPVTIPANTNKSPLKDVLLFVPSTACSGDSYTLSTNTYNSTGSTLLGSVTQAVTVK